jgi:hypothetical protein
MTLQQKGSRPKPTFWRKPGKHLLNRVRPQFLWREDIGASSRTLLEQAAGKLFNEAGAVTSWGPISPRKGTPQACAKAR